MEGTGAEIICVLLGMAGSQPRSPYSGQLVQKVEGMGISAGSTGHQQRGPGPPMPRH